MGGEGVPSDGGWPLALSQQLYSTISNLDINTYEQNKQNALKSRFEKFVKKHREKAIQKHPQQQLKRFSFDSIPIYIQQNHIFETRQFDYKKSNHLDFTYENDYNEHELNDTLQLMEWTTIQQYGRNVLFKPLREEERKTLLIRDYDMCHNNNNHEDDDDDYSNDDEHHNSHNDTCYDDTTIRHVRNELEKIRIQRSEVDSAGCSCRKIHVTVMSNNHNDNTGTSGRKHHHRRLTERKVKEELRKRHINIPSNAKREDLEQLLHDTVEKQGCCYGNDCICVRNGIECQLDTCSCWNASHSYTGTSHHHHHDNDDVPPALDEILSRCGNKFGCYVVDFEEINANRKKFINANEKKLCDECHDKK